VNEMTTVLREKMSEVERLVMQQEYSLARRLAKSYALEQDFVTRQMWEVPVYDRSPQLIKELVKSCEGLHYFAEAPAKHVYEHCKFMELLSFPKGVTLYHHDGIQAGRVSLNWLGTSFRN